MKLLCGLLLLTTFAANARVPANANDVQPLLPGMQIPKIVAKTVDGKELILEAKKLTKPFVLNFYRGGWCPYCNQQLAGLRNTEKDLIALGYDVYFISSDSPEKLVSSLKDQDLKKTIDYKLLSDASMKISRDFGVAFQVDDETVEKYKKWNIDLEQASGYDHHQLPVPATYVVSADGMIKFMYANPNYSVRLDPSILIAAAKSALKKPKKSK